MSHSNSQPLTEFYHQADLSMLAIRVVTAVLVTLCGSFTYKMTIVPSVYSQVFTPSIPPPAPSGY